MTVRLPSDLVPSSAAATNPTNFAAMNRGEFEATTTRGEQLMRTVCPWTGDPWISDSEAHAVERPGSMTTRRVKQPGSMPHGLVREMRAATRTDEFRCLRRPCRWEAGTRPGRYPQSPRAIPDPATEYTAYNCMSSIGIVRMLNHTPT